MTRLLVTGGAGFIGSAVVRAALARGWQVRVFDSFVGSGHGDRKREPDGDVDLVRADLADTDALERALDEVDAVSHQAAKVGLGVDFDDAPDYAATNVVGTAALLAAMRRQGVRRLVLASSMVVYGEGCYRRQDAEGCVRPAARAEADLAAGIFDPRDDRGAPLQPGLVDEDAALDPRNVYASTKLAQEHLAANWARETGGAAAMLRYHNVYGPGLPRDTPYAGVAAIFRSALDRGEPPRVFEDGGQRRDFVHVDDVAAANVAATQWALAGAPRARAFNIGSGRVTTVLELAQGLAAVMGGPDPVVTGEYRVGDVRHITASSARARSELGWTPRVELEAGLARFADAPRG